MIRIDTIEDLVRVLDDHPDWREAVRVRLLSRELLELPSRFSDFVAETTAFRAEMNRFVAETKAFHEEMTTFVAETKAFREEMTTFVAETKAFVAETKAFVAETKAFVAETKAFREEMTTFVAETKAFREEMTTFVAETKAFREEMTTFVAETKAFVAEMKTFKAEMNDFVAATNRQFKSIRDDLGVLKGAHARNAAERNLGLIARSMGLRRRRVLDGEQLFDLAGEAGADMSDGAIQSYLQADLVFEAENDRGETVYAVLEVSYTANGRDTTRALRNAELVSRFTGAACRPVVASLRVDDRIAELIESGRVTWYRLPRRALEAA